MEALKYVMRCRLTSLFLVLIEEIQRGRQNNPSLAFSGRRRMKKKIARRVAGKGLYVVSIS